jgi:hypothetical protein
MIETERRDVWVYSFDNPSTFAGALAETRVIQRNQPQSFGEVATRSFTLGNPTATNIDWTGDANITVQSVQVAGTNPVVVSATLLASGLEPGTTVLSYESTREPTIENNRYVYRRTPQGSGGVADGFPFHYQISVLGDWSEVGTDTGQHQLVRINPLWTIERNFEFDGTHTVFSAHIDSYFDSAAYDLNMQYVLYGAPVPEPESYALMLAGLLSIALFCRCRQRFPGCRPRSA